MEIQQTENQLATLSDERITAEILIYKDQFVDAAIEIGNRLIEMKKRKGHGYWLEYLKNEVDFSQQTASVYMRIAEENPNYVSGRNLGFKKLHALLTVPPGDREGFVCTAHTVEVKGELVEKTVDEMTVKEMKRVIEEQYKKELAEKDKLLQQAKNDETLYLTRVNNLNGQILELKNAKDKAYEYVEEKDKQIKKLKTEVKTEIIYEESPELQKALWEAQQKANELNEKLAEAEEELEKLSKIKEAGFEIVEMKKNIDNLKAEYTNIQLESNNNQIIFDTIKKLKNFVATEITPIGTLVIPYNTAPTIQTEINNIVTVLEDLIYSVKLKFKII